jgi:hypothetical protein
VFEENDTNNEFLSGLQRQTKPEPGAVNNRWVPARAELCVLVALCKLREGKLRQTPRKPG